MNTLNARGGLIGKISKAKGWLMGAIGKSDGWLVGVIKASGKPTMQTNIRREAAYLNVAPVEVVWVTIDIPAMYSIESNTDWRVE